MKHARAAALVLVLLGCAAPVFAQQPSAPPSPGFADIARDLNARDFDSAVPKLRALVDRGDPRAMTALAEMMLNGVGVPKDPDAGFALVTRAAEGGDLLGMADLAGCFINAVGTSRDLEQGRQWARRAAAAGVDLGQVLIDVAYLLDPANAFIRTASRTRPATMRLAGARSTSARIRSRLSRCWARGRPGKRTGAVPAAQSLHRQRRQFGSCVGGCREAASNHAQLRQERYRGAGAAAGNRCNHDDTPTVCGHAPACVPNRAIRPCGICTTAKIVGVAVLAPVRNAAYLPASVPAVHNLVLLSGEWDEQWIFDVCGSTMDAVVWSTADGMGGAYVKARLLQ